MIELVNNKKKIYVSNYRSCYKHFFDLSRKCYMVVLFRMLLGGVPLGAILMNQWIIYFYIVMCLGRFGILFVIG